MVDFTLCDVNCYQSVTDYLMFGKGYVKDCLKIFLKRWFAKFVLNFLYEAYIFVYKVVSQCCLYVCGLFLDAFIQGALKPVLNIIMHYF